MTRIPGRPGRIASVINQLSFLRTSDAGVNLSRAVHIHGLVSTAREAAGRYRTAVLVHEDLSQRLCALLGYGRAGMWGGYVPARTDGHGGYNDSPYRQALARIVGEAVDRCGDRRPYDVERLALVPESRIRTAWMEQPRAKTPSLLDDERTGAF